MMHIYQWQSLSHSEKDRILSRTISLSSEKIKKHVYTIIKEVRKKQDAALRTYTRSFDGVDVTQLPLRVEEEEFEEAERLVPPQIKEAINFSIQNALLVQKSQKEKDNKTLPSGVSIEHVVHPLESVGIYVPRGRGSFPSMVYMQAVPASLAGVPRIVMVSPPEHDGKVNAGCLYAARCAGVHEVYRVGGAQSIAALAYGTESIKKVVKIVGPGSKYVSLAKHLVGLDVDTGTITGPSEAAIIADASTAPEYVAQDLLIEAEHGSDSVVLLLSPEETFAQRVADRLEAAVARTPEPQRTFLDTVLARFAVLIVVKDLSEAVSVAEAFAPEHLMLHGEKAIALAYTIHNAGEILCGIPFSIANYALGANSILPTHGFSRSASALSVNDFQRTTAVIHANNRGLKESGSRALHLADYEKFFNHAAALRMRGIT